MASCVDEPMVVHGVCYGPSHGRRFVYGLFHDTVHGFVVGIMEHAKILGSPMASSMAHHVLTMNDAMVVPMVHANTTCTFMEYTVGTHGTCHRMSIHG